MKKILLLVLMCLPLLFGSCVPKIQDVTITIHGEVIDKATQVPLDGVVLTLSPNPKSLTTGTDGLFIFANIEHRDEYTLQALKDGYRPDRRSVISNPGETVKIVLMLEKNE